MGVVIQLVVYIEMHYMGISNAFPMRTANLHTSGQFKNYRNLSTSSFREQLATHLQLFWTC